MRCSCGACRQPGSALRRLPMRLQRPRKCQSSTRVALVLRLGQLHECNEGHPRVRVAGGHEGTRARRAKDDSSNDALCGCHLKNLAIHGSQVKKSRCHGLEPKPPRAKPGFTFEGCFLSAQEAQRTALQACKGCCILVQELESLKPPPFHGFRFLTDLHLAAWVSSE